MKKITAIIERTKDGLYSVAPADGGELEYGIIGEGRTPEDAIADFQKVYKAMRARYAELGKRFTEVDFNYTIDTPSVRYAQPQIYISSNVQQAVLI